MCQSKIGDTSELVGEMSEQRGDVSEQSRRYVGASRRCIGVGMDVTEARNGLHQYFFPCCMT